MATKIDKKRGMEILHFNHDHPLTLDRMDDSGETCTACSRPIYDQGFACSSCGFLLHEKCALLPRELCHHLHPQHPLTLVFDPPEALEPLNCMVCRKSHPGFMYRCSVCKYSIDINCSSRNQIDFSTSPTDGKSRKLHHFSHDHELKLRYLAKQSGIKCKGCGLTISGPAYCSGEFALHKSCAQLPKKMPHPFHPCHELSLFTKSPYTPGNALCDACRKPIVGFVFHCSQCQFDLDLICLSKPPLKHENHCHPLFYFEDTNLDVSCTSCGKKCQDSLYRCIPCKFNIHSTCLTFLSIIKHKHHQHTLTLKDSVIKDDSGLFSCESCQKRITHKQQIYYCTECKYGVHLECVIPEDHPKTGKLLEEIARALEDAEAIAANFKQDMNSLSKQLQALAGKYSSMSNHN